MKKLLSTVAALSIFASTSVSSVAYADVAVNALPTLNSATNGTVTTTGNNMNVQIAKIKANTKTNFLFTGISRVVLYNKFQKFSIFF